MASFTPSSEFETQKVRCETCPDHPDRVFCPVCGKADKQALRGVRLAGFIGVLHSTSPKIAEFWETGDPEVFSRPS